MKHIFSKTYWGDQDLSVLVGQILRIGVIIASITVLFGGVLYLIAHGNERVPDYQHFVGEGAANTTLFGIVHGAFQHNIPQIIQLGVLILVFTPIVRVIGSLFGFVIERDVLYIVITLIVLAVITFSILSGIKG